MKEAMFWDKAGKNVICKLCPRTCIITEGGTGFCKVRKNVSRKLFSLIYGKAVAMNVDPIEKKPLFHFAPGSDCLSVATVGCNLDCDFCQNWDISHPESITGENVSPMRLVEMALERNLPGIAYTYTEPTIFFEYAYETMKIAKSKGLYNVWVSNAYTSPEAVKTASKYLDAINIDIKGNREFYRKICKVPDNSPILEAAELYSKSGVHVEITNLVIPQHNDSREEIRKICIWIREKLGDETPIHFSRFRPEFRMKGVPPTGIKTLESAVEIARDVGLKWVYIGNVPGHKNENTICPDCGRVLIKRDNYGTRLLKTECDCGMVLRIKGKRWSPLFRE